MELAVRSRSMWIIQKLKAVAAGRGVDKSASLWSYIKNNQVRGLIWIKLNRILDFELDSCYDIGCLGSILLCSAQCDWSFLDKMHSLL